jgi:hypothetical protein
MNANLRNQRSPARRVTTAGLIAAISIVLLYLMYILPTLRFTLLFLLSLLPVVLSHEKRYADAILSFAAAALLSGLLFPAKGAWLLYVAFFGWYGILHEFIVTKLNKVWSWVALAAVFNASFFALYFLAGQFVADLGLSSWLQSLLIPAAEVAFLLFENLFGLCCEYYEKHLRKLLFKPVA